MKNDDFNMGTVLISMNIMSTTDANGKPVGEGQEEPNEDPRLDAPTAGRDLGALMAGLG